MEVTLDNWRWYHMIGTTNLKFIISGHENDWKWPKDNIHLVGNCSHDYKVEKNNFKAYNRVLLQISLKQYCIFVNERESILSIRGFKKQAKVQSYIT